MEEICLALPPAYLVAIVIATFSAASACLPSSTPTNSLENIPISIWDHSVNLRTWSGYKDNVLLGNAVRIESAFLAGGLDLMLFRLPVDATEFQFFASADYIRYLSTDQVDQETTALGQIQLKHDLRHHWQAGLSLTYFYFDQVLDASTLDRDFASLQIQGHSLALHPSLRRDLFDRFWTELEFTIGREEYQTALDDYWEVGPKLTLGASYGHKSEATLSYESTRHLYDTWVPRDPLGAELPGSSLLFYRHELALTLRHNWDSARHWRTLSKLAFVRNDDNGSGYYDYNRFQLNQQLRWVAKTWQIKTDARLWYYDYDSQLLSPTDPRTRQKYTVTLGARIENEIIKSLRLFAEYEYQRSISNLHTDEYYVNTAFAGLDWEF